MSVDKPHADVPFTVDSTDAFGAKISVLSDEWFQYFDSIDRDIAVTINNTIIQTSQASSSINSVNDAEIHILKAELQALRALITSLMARDSGDIQQQIDALKTQIATDQSDDLCEDLSGIKAVLAQLLAMNSSGSSGSLTSLIEGDPDLELSANDIDLNASNEIGMSGNVNVVGDVGINGHLIIEQELFVQGAFLLQKNTNNFTASTTQTQGQTPTAGPMVFVTTCANANDVITLESVSRGRVNFISNKGAQTLQIFPASGHKIDGLATDASITLAAGSRALLVGFSATEWATFFKL